MALNMTPEMWRKICATAARYPTCTLRLHQHQGWVKSVTVEHAPVESDDGLALPPAHVQPTLVLSALATPDH